LRIDTEPPFISVIIPTLNEEKLISKTLSQFTAELKCKYKIEVIISDGGSSDNTLTSAKCFSPEKILTLKPGTKQNISIGRNLGACNSNGKLLYFFNGDTLIDNIDNFFGQTINSFKDEKTIALTCNVKVFPEEEKLSDTLFHKFYNNYAYLLNKFRIGMGRGECHMVRRNHFIKAKGYNEAMAAGEDFDLYRRLKKFGKIRFLRELTVFESPRRYRRFGYWGVFWDWTKNSMSVYFRGKALSKQWEQVR
jgi:glycosyltransferase involved in cell wall biosynthesis